MESQTLSIKISADIYWKLKSEIGKGKISRFVESVVSRELNERAKKVAQEKKEFEQKLVADYQREANQTPDKEDKMWEEAGVKDIADE